jgi:hypothetical protein
MDFVHDRLANGRQLKCLTMTDLARKKYRGLRWTCPLVGRGCAGFWIGCLPRVRCQTPLFSTTYFIRKANTPCGQISSVPSERPLCTSRQHSQWPSTWCEALLTIVIQGPRSGLDRTPHSRQPHWKLRALSTRPAPASTALANGVLHWEGVPQDTVDNRSLS